MIRAFVSLEKFQSSDISLSLSRREIRNATPVKFASVSPPARSPSRSVTEDDGESSRRANRPDEGSNSPRVCGLLRVPPREPVQEEEKEERKDRKREGERGDREHRRGGQFFRPLSTIRLACAARNTSRNRFPRSVPRIACTYRIRVPTRLPSFSISLFLSSLSRLGPPPSLSPPPFAAGSSDFRKARMWAGPDSRLPTPYFRR